MTSLMSVVMHFVALSIISFWHYPGSLQATTIPLSISDTTTAQYFHERGSAFLKQVQYDSAIFYTEKAYLIYEDQALQHRKKSVWQKYISCSLTLSDIYRDLGQYVQSLEYLNKALEIARSELGASSSYTADCYKKVGIVYHYQDQLEKAEENYLQARNVYHGVFGQNHVDVANIYENMGIISEQRGSLDEALSLYDTAFIIRQNVLPPGHPDFGRSFSNFGNVYLYKGEFDRAIDHHLDAVNTWKAAYGENHPLVASSYNNIGVTYDEKGNYDRAIQYVTRALDIYRQLYGDNFINVGVIYGNLAENYIEKGDYHLALEYNRRSLNILKDNLGEDHHFLASSYDVMGRIYVAKEDFESAIRYLRLAMEINTATLGAQTLEVAENHHALGEAFLDEGDPDQALAHFLLEREILFKNYGPQHPQLVANYTDEGKAWAARRKPSVAMECYHKALQLAEGTIGKRHPETAEIYLALGDVYVAGQDLHQGLAYYQKGLNALVPGNSDGNIFVNPDLQEVSSESVLLRALISKASTLSSVYFETKNGLVQLDAALATAYLQMSFNTFILVSETIEKMRIGYRAEDSKLLLARRSQEVFEEAIRISLELYDVTHDKNYKEFAFVFAENGKAAVLAEALSESRAYRFAGIPDSLLEHDQNLRADLAYYERTIQKEIIKDEGRDSAQLKVYQNRHFQLRREMDQWRADLETNYPEFYNLKYPSVTVSVSEIQEELDAKSGIVSYFVGESSLYIFTITTDQFKIEAVPIEDTFSDKVSAFYRAIKKFDTRAYTENAITLYDLLISPIENALSQKSHLVIIPDGILYYLPFEALLTTDEVPAGNEFHRYPYFIRQHQFSYHYSVTLLSNSGDREENDTTGNGFVGFAPVFDENNDALALSRDEQSTEEDDVITIEGQWFRALPYSREEVAAIVDLFNASNLPAKGHFYNEASEENFKVQSQRARFLHIATHGLMNEHAPELTGLLFAQPRDSLAGEDGILYSGETFNLFTGAELAVLSSCESGLGQLVKGEGLMALTRGFMYSGVDNVVVSLWKVFDRQTRTLMVEFYRNILAGRNYPEALQQAKLAMIDDPGTAFPQKWSGFVLIGDRR